MADAVEDALNNIANRLYDNIIGTHKNDFLSNASLSTKESVVKDNILLMTENLFKALNNEFSDVTFHYTWQCGWVFLNEQMHKLCVDAYDLDHCDDEADLDDFHNSDTGKEMFYKTSIQEINIKISFFWKRKCSLGHTHYKERYHIVNMAKLLDIASFFKCGMPVRTIVKEFIPDFFYDPMQPPKKRGRPRSSHS